MPYDEPHFASSFLGDDIPEPGTAPPPQAVMVPQPMPKPALFDTKRLIIMAIVAIVTILILKQFFDKKQTVEEG